MSDFDSVSIIFGQRLKDACADKNINPATLAMTQNKSATLISMWLNGEKTPSAESLVKLSYLLEVTTDYLLGLEPKNYWRRTKIIYKKR